MKKIIITGAASGLGKALAEHFSSLGWQILAVDIQDEAGKKLVESLQTQGGKAEYYHCNVGDVKEIKSLFQTIASKHSQIDALINNAGVASVGPLESTTEQEWKRLIDIDLMSVIYATQYCLPLLKQSSSAHVVNIASFAGLALMPGMMSYNVAKAGVIAFSETLQGELAPYNIGVSVVCPAFFQTNLVESMGDVNEKVRSFIEKQMTTSGISAADVAKDVEKAITNNRFMVISHKSARWQHLFKRWFPKKFMQKKANLYRNLKYKNSENPKTKETK